MLFQGCAGLGALKGAQTRQGLSTAIPLFFTKFHTSNSQTLFILKTAQTPFPSLHAIQISTSSLLPALLLLSSLHHTRIPPLLMAQAKSTVSAKRHWRVCVPFRTPKPAQP
jgi:hypothetical protein